MKELEEIVNLKTRQSVVLTMLQIVVFYHKQVYHFCFRSSRPELFLGKGVLKLYNKFTEENPCRKVISIKLLCNFIEITL